jgi:hypothetical protein
MLLIEGCDNWDHAFRVPCSPVLEVPSSFGSVSLLSSGSPSSCVHLLRTSSGSGELNWFMAFSKACSTSVRLSIQKAPSRRIG